jgi:hypothetical protein
MDKDTIMKMLDLQAETQLCYTQIFHFKFIL